MSHSQFENLEAELATAGVNAGLARLADALRRENRYDELFEARLMQSRHRLGLAVVSAGPLEDLQEPLRGKLEDSYLEACREVGMLWLRQGQLRRGWTYLQAVGDKATVAEALAKIEPDDENVEQLVDMALNAGVAPLLGMQLVLKQYGTCNAITAFEGAMHGWQQAEQRDVATMLVRHLHRELVSNLQADIARREGQAPAASTICELTSGRDWLFEDHNYHVDASHLSATVNFARLTEDKAALALAMELTQYGSRLDPQYHYPGEEPFADVYEAHGRFFATLLDEQVEQNLEFFCSKARELSPEQHGFAPAEIYVTLLARLGRYNEAIDAAAELIPRGSPTSGFAPGLLELSQKAGCFDRLIEICRERGDLVGFVAGLVQRKEAGS